MPLVSFYTPQKHRKISGFCFQVCRKRSVYEIGEVLLQGPAHQFEVSMQIVEWFMNVICERFMNVIYERLF